MTAHTCKTDNKRQFNTKCFRHLGITRTTINLQMQHFLNENLFQALLKLKCQSKDSIPRRTVIRLRPFSFTEIEYMNKRAPV